MLEESASEPRRKFRLTLKLLLFFTVLYYFVVPILPNFRNAFEDLRGSSRSC